MNALLRSELPRGVVAERVVGLVCPDHQTVEEFQTAIKTKLNEFQNPPRDFKISIQIFTLRFPEQSVDLRKYIELIEET